MKQNWKNWQVSLVSETFGPISIANVLICALINAIIVGVIRNSKNLLLFVT